MKKPSITIAIPAYNEERNIVALIKSVQNQKRANYALNSIKVYCDGCTDKTVELVHRNFKRVKVIDSNRNLGKNARINQLMKDNKNDVLIQVDADIIIKNPHTFENLVNPLLKNNNVGISCAYHLANPSTKLVGKISFFGFRIWERARKSLGRRGVKYYCEGGLRAFSRKFTNQFRLPLGRHIGEDSYSFYFAVSNGFKVVVSKKAKVYIDLAENLTDYSKQMKRFLTEPKINRDTFSTGLVKKYETMTPAVKIYALIREFAINPLIGVFYILLQFTIKLQTLLYKPPKRWIPISRKA